MSSGNENQAYFPDEEKENVRQRLKVLLELSQDPYYDQYLNQMLRDLESGKATPRQVNREADRTWLIYQQRMSGQGQTKPNQAEALKQTEAPKQTEASKQTEAPKQTDYRTQIGSQKQAEPARQNHMEFKVGAGIFSLIGGAFVLVALVIMGYHLLHGIWQGLSLYGIALVVVVLSELLLKKWNVTFSKIITGIGISSLFIITVINYMVLENIGGLTAAVITLLIALLSVWIGRKEDTAFLRLIGFLGSYICFLPAENFPTDRDFLMVVMMLFLINLVNIFLPNQKNRELISMVHMIFLTVFTGILTGIASAHGIQTLYIIIFIISSMVLLNLIAYRQKDEWAPWLTAVSGTALGIMTLLLVFLAWPGSTDGTVLFNRFLAEVMAILTALIFFILWGKEKQRWIQYYFIVGTLAVFCGFSSYRLETTIGLVLIFLLTRCVNLKKKLTVCDGILTVYTALQGLYMVQDGNWYAVVFLAAMFLGIFLIREMVLFHQLVTTCFFLLTLLIQMDSEWVRPLGLLLLFVLFLLFNHLPACRKKGNLIYNIINVAAAGLICLSSCFCRTFYINSVSIVIGAVFILVAFTKRYDLFLKRKYLLLAGFLTYMILCAHFEMPVMISILLMIIALVCVGTGFWLKDRVYRICGLTEAVLVCMKLILYDFRELPALQRAILFFAVGVMALGISFLYIYLEKRMEKEEVPEQPVDPVQPMVPDETTAHPEEEQQ